MNGLPVLPFDGEASPSETPIYRVCNKCKVNKPIDCYHPDKGRRDALKRHPVCKTCCDSARRALAKAKKMAPPRPAVCECCGRDPGIDSTCRGWCVDHDYITGDFRGWICQTCNIGLGHFRDSVEGLMKGIRYLSRTSSNGTLES